MDKDLKQFTQQYLASCKEHIERLANNPELLQKTLEPFMKIQEQYLSDNNLSLELDEEDSGEGYSSDIDKLKDKVKRLNREAVKLGYRIALMKPKSNEGNSNDTSTNSDKV